MLFSVKEDESLDPTQASLLGAAGVMFHPQQRADFPKKRRFWERHIVPLSPEYSLNFFGNSNPK
jgi:hypothetical protein